MARSAVVVLFEEARHRLAVRNAELAEDGRDVPAHGDRRHAETMGDLRGAELLAQELEHLPLTIRQLDATTLEEPREGSALGAAELLEHARDEGTGQRRLALEHAAKRR